MLLHARNGNAVLETMFASWMLGAVWVPTNVRLTPPEVAYLAASSGASVHIFDAGFPQHAAAAKAENPACRLEISIAPDVAAAAAEVVARSAATKQPRSIESQPGSIESQPRSSDPHVPPVAPLEWDALAAHGTPLTRAADVAHDHPAWFFYTSGTTGRPKAGVLTHGQMEYVVCNHLCDLMPATTEADVSLVVAPLSHGAGIHALPQVARGAATVLLSGERLDCEEAWRLVERHRVTNMFTVPTILTMLTRHESVDHYDHSSLRYVIYAGSPMYRADQVHALRKLGKVIVQYFGMGEVTGNITVLPREQHDLDDAKMRVGSCGVPRTGMAVAILDLAGRMLPPHDTGEICVRGPGVFAGYHNNPDATAQATRFGWFHTGDLGHADEAGFVYITGRASDMYISGGSNVYPREIEEALLLHPSVAEACVVGMPDARWGESGVAVLVAASDTAIDEAALRAHLAGRLARYKWPSRFVTWSELPKSGYGKVTKREVKQKLAEEG